MEPNNRPSPPKHIQFLIVLFVSFLIGSLFSFWLNLYPSNLFYNLVMNNDNYMMTYFYAFVNLIANYLWMSIPFFLSLIPIARARIQYGGLVILFSGIISIYANISLSGNLSELTGLPRNIYSVLFTMIPFSLFFLLLSTSKKLKTLGTILSIILTFVFFSTILPTYSSKVSQKNFQEERNAELATVDFTVYYPAYKPDRYKEQYNGLQTWNKEPYFFEFTYFPADPLKYEYKVDIFKASEIYVFNPPTACTGAHPAQTYIDIPCSKIGVTNLNTDVFKGFERSAHQNIYYTKVEETMVTLTVTAIEDRTLPDSEVLKIFNSLEERSKDSFK